MLQHKIKIKKWSKIDITVTYFFFPLPWTSWSGHLKCLLNHLSFSMFPSFNLVITIATQNLFPTGAEIVRVHQIFKRSSAFLSFSWDNLTGLWPIRFLYKCCVSLPGLACGTFHVSSQSSFPLPWWTWGPCLPHFIATSCEWTIWSTWDSAFSSVQFSGSVVSDSLWPHELQHTRLPCPSPAPRVHPNPCPLSRWGHPTISSSVIPFSSCPQSFPASGSFQMSQLFTSGGQSIGVAASTSILPMNTQAWSPLGWTGWISLLSKGLSRVFSNTTVQKHQFFGAQLSL